ncbi:MAG TPA: hypothetical protein VIF82_02130 [Burkholderiaceae bacterium]|jgi:hypothetical protein
MTALCVSSHSGELKFLLRKKVMTASGAQAGISEKSKLLEK